MKLKSLTTALCLLLTGLSYSQNVLINEETGDTLVTITINQMDDIYIELIQKDSLSDQSRINALRETKHLKLIDSANKDISTLKTANLQLERKVSRYKPTVLVMGAIIILQFLIK
jgi:hypothetical protein